jgi:clan AA aspartic protease
MGQVMTKLILENSWDRGNAENGIIPWDQVRHVEVEALVDTGAVMLALPADIVNKLGVKERERRVATLADGSTIEVGRVLGLYIRILDRDMMGDAIVLPVGSTPLIGQLQLEALDLIVDPRSQEVRGRFPDGPVLELRRAS